MHQEEGEVGRELHGCLHALRQSVFSQRRCIKQHTLRSSCRSWDFSMTSTRSGLHLAASVTKAYTCLGCDLRSLELKTFDFRELSESPLETRSGAAS